MNKKAIVVLVLIIVLILGYKLLAKPKVTEGELAPVQDAQAALDDALQSGKPVFLEFASDSCPACKTAKPWINEFYTTYGEQVNFIIADTEKGGLELAQQLGVRAVPTFVLFNAAGKMADAFAGYPPTNGKKYLEDKIKSLLE